MDNKFPSLRDIFDSFDLDEVHTDEFIAYKDKLCRDIEIMTSRKQLLKIESELAVMAGEAQYTGFVQGFEFARTLFTTQDLFTAETRFIPKGEE